MRQFIREHPWQLEIVPALAVATGVGAAVYCCAMLSTASSWPPLALQVQRWLTWSVGWLAASIAFSWIVELHANHGWVTTERKKRFNWPALIFQSVIVVLTWIAVFLAYVTFTDRPYSIPSETFDLLASALRPVLALCLCLTAFLEWRRPCLPKTENPQIGEQVTDMPKREFDSRAATYDQPHAVLRGQKIAEAIRRQVRLNADMDAMDYGAGTGLVTLAIQPYVRSITAVDSSRGMLAVLEQKAEAQGITNVKTVYCDFESDRLPDLRFDLIICAMTLHHVAHVEDLLRSFHEMLTPAGVLAVADLDTEAGDFHPDNTGIQHFGLDREEMKRFFENVGFSGVQVSTAHTTSKEVASRETKEFSVFLITGNRG